MENPDVICLGETMAMITPTRAVPLQDSDLFQMLVGGAESTVAMYLAERGHRAAWVSALGEDPFAVRILRALSAQDVDLSYVTTVPGAQTGVYFKDPGGPQTTVHYYRKGSAASRMGPEILAGLPLESARLVHTTGITPALSPSCGDLVLALCERLRGTDTRLSFDVNYRPGLWTVDEAGATLLSIARQADVVFVGRDEAEVLWGTTDAASVRDLVGPVGRLVVKDGAVGATEFHGGEAVFVPAAQVDVVEVVGAGDAFAAGYLAARLQGSAAAEALLAGHELAARTLRSMDDFVPVASGIGMPGDDHADPSNRQGVPQVELKTSFDALFQGSPVMAILRGYAVDRTVELANLAWDVGVDCVEVPIQTPDALAALAATVEAGAARGKAVGAGTVTSGERVRQAADAGAAFTVSPGIDPDVVRLSVDLGLPTLPGVATASEVQLAQRLGLDWVKAFPAAVLGPSWFSAMHGPFPAVRLVATGGVDVRNAADFLQAGARVVALGSALSDPGALPAIAALARPDGGAAR